MAFSASALAMALQALASEAAGPTRSADTQWVRALRRRARLPEPIYLHGEDSVEEVLGIIRDSCHSRTQLVNPMPPILEPGEFFLPYPLEVEVGGATVFVLPVERFERL